MHAASEAFAAAQEDLPSALVLDMRRAAVYEQARTMIPGVRWCDAPHVDTRARALPADREPVLWRAYRRDTLADQ